MYELFSFNVNFQLEADWTTGLYSSRKVKFDSMQSKIFGPWSGGVGCQFGCLIIWSINLLRKTNVKMKKEKKIKKSVTNNLEPQKYLN